MSFRRSAVVSQPSVCCRLNPRVSGFGLNGPCCFPWMSGWSPLPSFLGCGNHTVWGRCSIKASRLEESLLVCNRPLKWARSFSCTAVAAVWRVSSTKEVIRRSCASFPESTRLDEYDPDDQRQRRAGRRDYWYPRQLDVEGLQHIAQSRKNVCSKFSTFLKAIKLS